MISKLNIGTNNMENVQLIKKRRQGGYKDIFPRTFLNAIRDKESGATLTEILQGFNMYFLSHTGSRESTRLQIPSFLRREGLWITYVLYDHTVITEWYNSEKIDDESWKSDSNWRVGSNALVGDISISSDGYWVINGIVSETKAQGEQGVTPLLRIGDNNKLQVSYNEGKQWNDISDLIVPKFRWLQGEGTTAGTVQISMDLGKTWSNLSNPISNNLRIKKYIGINESLPTSGVEEGTIYMKGPYYAEDDTLNDNPIYRMWVYAWKGNTLAWQDNGEFTSIVAGVVQETGDSETEVMSQKAVSERLSELGLKLETSFENNRKVHYLNIDTINGVIEVIEDIYWCYSYGSTKDNYIAKGTKFTIKPSEFRSQIDRGGGFVKFAFNINTGTITTLNYLDLVQPSEVIIGVASSAYGVEYSSFNWVYFNVDWDYTIDGVDEKIVALTREHTSKHLCYFIPGGIGTIYEGHISPDSYTLYDSRYHEICDVSSEIECYTQNKWQIRLSFYDADKNYLTNTGSYSRLFSVIPPSNAKYLIISILEVDKEGTPVATSINNYTIGDVVISNVKTTPFITRNVFVYRDDAIANIDTASGILKVTSNFDLYYGPNFYTVPSGLEIPIKQTEINVLATPDERSIFLMTSQTNIVFNVLTKEIYPRGYGEQLRQHEIVLGIIRNAYGNGYTPGSFQNADLPFRFTIDGLSLYQGDKRFEVSFMNSSNENYFNVDTVKGNVTVLKDIYWGYSYGSPADNRIPASTEFTIKPSEFRSKVDRGSGLVKFAFDMNTGAIVTLNYLDLIKSSEIIIGMASSSYGTTYSSFNCIHFNTDWNYTIDGVSPTGSGASTIFTRNADEVEIMETFGASTWYEEFGYNNYGETTGWIPKLSLIHVSDTHASRNHFGNNYDIITQELVAFANKVSTNRGTNFNRGNRVKCVVHSGDIKYSVGSDDFTYYADAVIKSNVPFFHALGNHDIGNESTMLVEYAITDAQAYEQMIAPFLESWNLNCANPDVCEAHPEGKCYFFNDFETEKIRLITLYGFETRFELDESDSTKLKYRRDTESWSQEQIDWLVNSLLNLPEGWGVMINQHYPFGTSTGESAFLSYAKCSRVGTLAIINDIVQAFIDGTNLVRQYTQADIITPTISVNCDFSHKKANTEFIAFLSGHTHRDCIGRIEDYPDQLQLNVGCNNTFYDEGSDVTHAMGKKGQDMFNVYCIDRNNGLINILRIGANISCFGQKRELETIKYR